MWTRDAVTVRLMQNRPILACCDGVARRRVVVHVLADGHHARDEPARGPLQQVRVRVAACREHRRRSVRQATEHWCRISRSQGGRAHIVRRRALLRPDACHISISTSSGSNELGRVKMASTTHAHRIEPNTSPFVISATLIKTGGGQGGRPSGAGGKRRRRRSPGEKNGQSRQDAARRLREGGGCGTAPA